MYKIIFKNPEDETKRLTKTLTEFEAQRAMKAKTDRGTYSIPGFGMVASGMIISITKAKNEFKKIEDPKTRYETQKPTTREWQSLIIGFVYTHPHKVIFNATPSFLENLGKGLWNLNNKRTADCIEIGEGWLNDGKDFRMLMHKIQES